MIKINMIFARSANGVIGNNNAMPWHLPEDLAHFKKLTLGHPVIMGRKTWDSLPGKFRPLPGRANVVITRQPDWQAPGAQIASSLQEALALCQAASDVWVIGGAQIYMQAEPLACTIEVTHIDKDFVGDAFAPTLGDEWVASRSEAHVSSTGLNFRFITYTKNSLDKEEG